MNITTLIRQSHKALDGRHPEHDFPINNGSEKASALALVALAEQQQETNRHLASIAESLAALAAAPATPPNAAAIETEPKRRLWLPTRRTKTA